jgi:citrate lyase subunit beta/citryl-CoA lyase
MYIQNTFPFTLLIYFFELIALDEAAKKGQGAASLDGRLIDAASAKMAENIVATDKAINSKK